MSKPSTRILVTGAGGLLGSTLMRVLPEAGFEAIAFRGDVRDATKVETEIAGAAPAFIIHCAALTNVGACERDPDLTFAINAEGTKRVVRAAQAAAATMVYISTASVFKGDAGNYREDDEPEPENVYNVSKRKGEKYTLDYDAGIVLRLNLIGVHPDGSRGVNFLEWLLDGFRSERNMSLFIDSLINPLSNWTIAALIVKILIQTAPSRILHLGSRDVLSKAAIGDLTRRRFPYYRSALSHASIDTIADGVWRPKQMWLNVDKASAALGPMPTVANELEVVFDRCRSLAQAN
jgi:dTDP-4-dehydrorhamnose reductase